MPDPVKGRYKHAQDMKRYKYRQAIGNRAAHIKFELAGSFFIIIEIIHLAISAIKFFYAIKLTGPTILAMEITIQEVYRADFSSSVSIVQRREAL